VRRYIGNSTPSSTSMQVVLQLLFFTRHSYRRRRSQPHIHERTLTPMNTRTHTLPYAAITCLAFNRPWWEISSISVSTFLDHFLFQFLDQSLVRNGDRWWCSTNVRLDKINATLSALMDLYIHPLYILVTKILFSILNSPASIYPLYHPLSTVWLTCHFI
jgi:hypothetical protein